MACHTRERTMMDRRMFVKSTFGLVVLAACPTLASLTGCVKGFEVKAEGALFTTPFSGEPETASGPLLMAGIDLCEVPGAGRVAAYYGGNEVFNMDASGAMLVMLADGSRTIGDIADEAAVRGCPVDPMDAALFFSSLCEAGYLRNIVRVGIAG